MPLFEISNNRDFVNSFVNSYKITCEAIISNYALSDDKVHGLVSMIRKSYLNEARQLQETGMLDYPLYNNILVGLDIAEEAVQKRAKRELPFV